MLLTVLLLLLIARLIELETAIALIRNADWRWMIACFVVVQLQVLLSAIRWQVTAVRLGQVLSVPHAVREYYLATLGNLSLPGGITGDAARVYRNRDAAGVGKSAQSVLIERLAGQLALLVVTLGGWVLWPLLMDSAAPELGEKMILTALLLLVALVLVFRLVVRFAPPSVANFMAELGPSLYCAWWADRQWLVQGALSLGVVATYLAVFAICALALQHPLPFVGVVTIVPLVLLSMVIPISIGGWGVREAVAASLWPVLGMSAEAGVASSVLYGVISLLATIPGALWAALRPSDDRCL
ncbi:hypothetical protein IMCC3135_05415 [Granulosicoccus antarcticus IMCC3135]|uniref:Uncharacterized protein n=2 Tax=Granulosicoccus TaxID=437504 RepID=A0A2Z2NKZ6_9GAMM|nr:hypothetical protein IMCC3135_05415 [Granulosicoccus antarcticus IMCC3135]